MASSRVPEDAAVDGTVYFCYEHAADSFSGILDDKLSMSDENIKEFIQYDNPALYQRLRELPFSSKDIPMSYYAQRSLRRSQDIHESYAKGNLVEYCQIPEGYGPAVLQSTSKDRKDSDDRLTIRMLILQLKRHVQSCLLNGYTIILRKVPASGTSLWCDSPSCTSDNLILHNAFYLTLEQNPFHYVYTSQKENLSQKRYCLSCLEDVFDGSQNIAIDIADRVAEAKLDGIGRDSVMKAANRLYYVDRLSKGLNSIAELDHTPPLTLNQRSEPSLSKSEEMRSRLVKTDKLEKKHCALTKMPTRVSHSLVTTDLSPVGELKDRYNKQGWSRFNKEPIVRAEQASKSTLSSDLEYTSSETSKSPTPRICYCRKPLTEYENIVRCANEGCSIGLFHLRCTRLDVITQDGRLRCLHCITNHYEQHQYSNIPEMEHMTAENDLVLRQAERLAEYDIESEGSIESDVDLIDPTPTTTFSTALRCGKPINLESGPASCSMPPLQPATRHASDSAPIFTPSATCTASDQTDGFTAINTPPRTTTHHSHPRNSPRGLFPGSTSTTFADLAPFITAADLTTEENEVFNEWKHSLPPSRLVRFLMLGEAYVEVDADSGLESGSYDFLPDQSNGDLYREGSSIRLSQLLANVQK